MLFAVKRACESEAATVSMKRQRANCCQANSPGSQFTEYKWAQEVQKVQRTGRRQLKEEEKKREKILSDLKGKERFLN